MKQGIHPSIHPSEVNSFGEREKEKKNVYDHLLYDGQMMMMMMIMAPSE